MATVRRSQRISGSGARSFAGQIVSLSRRCSALERDVSMLSLDERIRKLARRLAKLEEEDKPGST